MSGLRMETNTGVTIARVLCMDRASISGSTELSISGILMREIGRDWENGTPGSNYLSLTLVTSTRIGSRAMEGTLGLTDASMRAIFSMT